MERLKTTAASLDFWDGMRKALLPPLRDAYTKKYDPKTCEVRVHTTVTLRDYEQITPADDMARLRVYAAAMAGKKLIFINATYAGGGVAIMRAPLIALLRALGVDAHWYVLKPDKKAFAVTKGKFHNVLQGVSAPGVELNAADEAIYWRWITRNAKALARPLRSADIIVIDDWQPTGLIPFIKGDSVKPGLNREAKVIFRDHIHSEGKLMSMQGTPQNTTWRYIWEHNQVYAADALVFHPRDEFVPAEVPDAKVVFMPATSDLFDDLNRPLFAKETQAGFDFIDKQLIRAGQKPLDSGRQYIVLIARFDPSKGMPEGLAAFARARAMMAGGGVAEPLLPQLVVAGNGSVDDPDGAPMLQEIMRLRAEKYAAIQDDIKVARIPHNDVALNALLRGSALALQPSTKEGFEMRVTDAILQGVPVLGSDRGGIPLQIIEGRSGFVIDPYDTEKWARHICRLMTDTLAREALRQQTKVAAKSHNYQFTTVPNAINWLHLGTVLLGPDRFEGNRQWVRDMAILSTQLPRPVGRLVGFYQGRNPPTAVRSGRLGG